MVKIKYPVDGLYNLAANEIDSIINNINESISLCDFDIPSNFNDSAYLSNLRNELNELVQRTIAIKNKCQEVDSNMDTLSNVVQSNINSIEDISIRPRNNLIRY